MKRLLVVVLVATLALTACSGEDAAPIAAPSPTADVSPADAPTARPGSGLRPDAPPFCGQYQKVMGRTNDPVAAAADRDEAVANVRATIAEMEDVAADAPEDVREPFANITDVSVQGLTGLAELLEGEHGGILFPMFRDGESPRDIPDSASDERVAARDAALAWIESAAAAYDESILEDAQTVGTWFTENCRAA